MSTDHDRKFDEAIRVQHSASLERLSPRVRAQLAQCRNTALRGNSVRRGHGLRYAVAGFAALGALAIGLRFGSIPATTANTPATSVAASAATPSTMLDEDPEFYAWLASSDAQQVAME